MKSMLTDRLHGGYLAYFLVLFCKQNLTSKIFYVSANTPMVTLFFDSLTLIVADDPFDRFPRNTFDYYKLSIDDLNYNCNTPDALHLNLFLTYPAKI